MIWLVTAIEMVSSRPRMMRGSGAKSESKKMLQLYWYAVARLPLEQATTNRAITNSPPSVMARRADWLRGTRRSGSQP